MKTDEEVMEQYPEVDPARRKLALAALANTAKRQRAERYWTRIEAAAREVLPVYLQLGTIDPRGHAITEARALVDEIDRQRAEAEETP